MHSISPAPGDYPDSGKKTIPVVGAIHQGSVKTPWLLSFFSGLLKPAGS
jgi:hypothetical protein